MAEYKTLAKVSDVEPGTLKQIELEDGKQVCLANVGGNYYAIGGECTHMGGPLGEGELEDNIVTCPWHAGQFDVTNGEVEGPPADDSAETYEVRIEGDEVQAAIE